MAGTEPEIHRGLDGVVVDTTAVSNVMQETNSLTYRGYPVQELAAQCSVEQVAYLLWQGELPDESELAEFTRAERAERALSERVEQIIDTLPLQSHPMDVVRTAVSAIGAEDSTADDHSPAATYRQALSIFAKVSTCVARDFRRRRGLPIVAPDGGLSYVENFFRMCFDEPQTAAALRCFEISLILYAEHSFNASTFTARVVSSTLSDTYSAVTAAIGALKGPLHGGANEAVMRMMLEIDDPARAARWLHDALARKKKIMGFGHRVYKHGDSRVPTMAAALQDLATTIDGADRWLRMYTELESAMLAERGIYPNLDFPSGPAYFLLGFDIAMFTPIFVMARIPGWTAHIMEQYAANSLIRPLSKYVGPAQRSLS
jgi:citrate synthase